MSPSDHSPFVRPRRGVLPLSLVAVWIGGCGPDDKDREGGVAPDDDPVASEPLCQVSVQCGGGILDDPKAPCMMRVDDGAGSTLYDGAAGLELRGRSSLTFPKPQYAVELREHYELPVWPGSTWRYFDHGTDLGAAWRQPDYDDASWPEGPGQLGYGEEYLQTTVNGPSITTYFRRVFDVAQPRKVTELKIGILRNDGAAVYLNGVEVLRDNLEADATFDTWADERTTFEESITWHEAEVDGASLVAGDNLLAVEVHQAEASPDDLRFDLFVEARGDDAPTDLLGMGKEEDWILNGQYVDRVLWRNRLAFDLFRSFGPDRYATELRFCELELDGEYMGLYTLGEKLERDGDRIDIGEGATPGDTFVIKLDDELGFHDNRVGQGTWQLVYPDPDPDVLARVSQYLTGWEDAIQGDPADPETGIFAYVDLASAVDWVLLQELAKNPDAYRLSVYLWKDEGGKMHFAPWDLDLTMGYPYTDCGSAGWNPRDYLATDGEVKDVAFIRAMAAMPAFREALVSRWQELRADVLSEEAVLARIEGYDATLAPALEDNLARWPIADIAFSTDYPEVVSNWLCPVTSYEEEHARTVAFLTGRLAWMDANLSSF